MCSAYRAARPRSRSRRCSRPCRGGASTLAAFAGAFLSILLVLGLARRELWRGEPQDASPRLLLTGAVIAAGWGALITLMLAVAPENRLRGMVFWLTGDLNGVAMPWTALIALVVALVAIVPAAPQLNVLLRGDAAAQALGVPVVRLRLRVYLVASLAAAAAVTTAGTIGFVGLVVPHVLRLAFGNDQRMLLPAAALGGRCRGDGRGPRRAHGDRAGAVAGRRDHGARSACRCSCGCCCGGAR